LKNDTKLYSALVLGNTEADCCCRDKIDSEFPSIKVEYSIVSFVTYFSNI